MNMEIKFKGLLDPPEHGQVIYYEEKRDSKANKFIRNNYDWLVALFAKHGLEFCYMPIRVNEFIGYHAPFATGYDFSATVLSLADFAVEHSLDGPALVFALDIPVKDDDGNVVLQCVPIVTKWFKSTKSTFKDLVLEIKRVSADRSIYYHRPEEEKRKKISEGIRCCRLGLSEDDPVRYSIADSDDGTRESRKSSGTKFSIMDEPEEQLKPTSDTRFAILDEDGTTYAPPASSTVRYSRKRTEEDRLNEVDNRFDYESKKLMDEVKDRIEALQVRGINLMFIKEFIAAVEASPSKLSQLRITKDKRIFLVDYGNREIKMGALVKAVFLLFLKHPEGIRFKELSDYYGELLNIYQSLNPRGSYEKQIHSIEEITNPFSNSINEKCARIREAFLGSFCEVLAQNYFVTGERGEAKRITLDRSLVIWEE